MVSQTNGGAVVSQTNGVMWSHRRMGWCGLMGLCGLTDLGGDVISERKKKQKKNWGVGEWGGLTNLWGSVVLWGGVVSYTYGVVWSHRFMRWCGLTYYGVVWSH